jgi:hypothetical protein
VKLAVALLLVSTGIAGADGATGLQDPANPIKPAPPPPPAKPDPIVERAAAHGVEPKGRHQGFNFTAALGGGLTVGVGIDDSVGRGPSGSFRFANAASEHFAFVAEVVSVTMFHQVRGTDESAGPTRTDQGNAFLLGMQFYVNRSLWLRVGGGIGGFRFDEGPNVDPTILPGLGGVGGGGFDLVRWKKTAIGIEMMTFALATRDGLLTTTAFMLDFSIE